MITKERLERVLPVVADNWKRLRRIDVFRLLNMLRYEDVKSLEDAGQIIIAERQDLKEEVEECVEELRAEISKLTHT